MFYQNHENTTFKRDSYCSVCGCTGGCNLCDDVSKYRI
nr:MAG TPA_asm: isomerase [Bacteriophage sp.]